MTRLEGVDQIVVVVSHPGGAATLRRPDRIGVAGGNHLGVGHRVHLLQFCQIFPHRPGELRHFLQLLSWYSALSTGIGSYDRSINGQVLSLHQTGR